MVIDVVKSNKDNYGLYYYFCDIKRIFYINSSITGVRSKFLWGGGLTVKDA